MRGKPLHSLNPQTLVKPFRDQFTPAEELRQDLEAEWLEENSWLEEIEPDPYDEAA